MEDDPGTVGLVIRRKIVPAALKPSGGRSFLGSYHAGATPTKANHLWDPARLPADSPRPNWGIFPEPAESPPSLRLPPRADSPRDRPGRFFALPPEVGDAAKGNLTMKSDCVHLLSGRPDGG